LLANADAEQVDEILLTLRGRSLYRLNQLVPRLLRELRDASSSGDAEQVRAAYQRTARHMEYLVRRDVEAAGELRKLISGEPAVVKNHLEKELAEFGETLEQTASREFSRAGQYIASVPPRGRAEDSVKASAVPERVPGATGPGLVECSHERRVEMAAEIGEVDPMVTFETLRPIGDELWFLMNGKRTLAEIRDAICFEFDVDIPQRYINELVDQLVEGGRVTLRT